MFLFQFYRIDLQSVYLDKCRRICLCSSDTGTRYSILANVVCVLHDFLNYSVDERERQKREREINTANNLSSSSFTLLRRNKILYIWTFTNNKYHDKTTLSPKKRHAENHEEKEEEDGIVVEQNQIELTHTILFLSLFFQLVHLAFNRKKERNEEWVRSIHVWVYEICISARIYIFILRYEANFVCIICELQLGMSTLKRGSLLLSRHEQQQ